MKNTRVFINERNKIISRITGVIFLALAAGITLKIQCPSSAQYLTLYTFFGVGLALLLPKDAEKASAKFTLKDASILLGGGVALPFILFVINPIDKFKSDRCSIQMTNITVSVNSKHGRDDKILRQGSVVLDIIGKDTRREPINDNGEVAFKNIMIGDSVRLNIDFSEPYKPVNPDSVFVIHANEKIYLPVRLDGIAHVRGKVIYGDAPLDAVKVELDGVGGELDTLTDQEGRYSFNIPERMQEKSYQIVFRKKGFKTDTAIAFPQTHEALQIIMKKK